MLENKAYGLRVLRSRKMTSLDCGHITILVVTGKAYERYMVGV